MAAISRQNYISLAELCKERGDYVNMLAYMKDLVESIDGAELTIEERKTYFSAAKLLMDFHRKRVDEVYGKELETNSDAERVLIRNYLQRLYVEMESACESVLVINDRLLQAHWQLRRNDDSPNDKYMEPLVKYHLQQGDCYRYISGLYLGRDDGHSFAETARKFYQLAWDDARKLAILDVEKIPTMLEVALKFSVFFSEILSSPQESLDMANEALKETTPKLRKMSWTSRDYSKSIIATFKKNLPVWISDLKKKQTQGSSSRSEA